jgi:hypothetical protein
MGSSRSGLIDSVAHATHVASYLAARFPSQAQHQSTRLPTSYHNYSLARSPVAPSIMPGSQMTRSHRLEYGLVALHQPAAIGLR